MFKFFPKIKQNNISFTSDKWIWGYKYNHAGQREQKRLLKSPHGDDGTEQQSFAHNWEYYMNGAFGEELIQYSGFQTVKESDGDIGRRVYLSVNKFNATSDLHIRRDGIKEVYFTDNNGNVRVVIDSNNIIKKYDYKPFGELYWSSDGSHLREGLEGSIFDPESELQMKGVRMYDTETGRFTTPDLLWAAFPSHTPYHYAYNSPLIWSDPSGLAPEKERDREKLMNIELDDFSDGYYFSIWNADEIERYNGMLNYHKMIFEYLDLMFSSICAMNDFDLKYNGGNSSGSGAARTGESGGTSQDDNQNLNGGSDKKNAKEMYEDDPDESSVLEDITEETRTESYNQTKREQENNKNCEAGGIIRYDEFGNQIVVEANVGKENANNIDVFSFKMSELTPELDNYSNTIATYHGHTNDRVGSFPIYYDLGMFMTHPQFQGIRYHLTYITTFPQGVYVWDNQKCRGYYFDSDKWRGK